MAFTGKNAQLASSGSARVMVAREARRRIAWFSDSMFADTNAGRYWHAGITMSLPRQFNGFGRSGFAAGADCVLISGTNSAPLTSAGTPVPIAAFGNPYTYGEYFGTSGNANNKGLIPVQTQEYVFGSNVPVDTLVSSAAIFPWQVHGTDGNTSTGYDPYSNVGQARNPFWWMDAMDLYVIVYDPSVANNTVDGPSIYIKRGRTVSGTTKDTTLGTAGTIAGGTGSVRIFKTSTAATINPLDFPKVEVYSAATQSTKRLIIIGFYFERSNATKGLGQFFYGGPGYRAGDWADTTAHRSSMLQALHGPASPLKIDAIGYCIGHNLRDDTNNGNHQHSSQLANGYSADMLADVLADLTRLRNEFGNLPVIILGTYKYDPAVSATKYANMQETFYQACLANGLNSFKNIYTNLGDSVSLIDSTGGQAVMTYRPFDGTNRHLIQQGSQAFWSSLWEDVLETDETILHVGVGGGGGIGIGIGL